ncbi:MAG: trypsin-like peptidase domain-containing protein [Rhodopirellula sp.]|nr:trypsin-like peptidase domain-containing protein [Rhodopirellula sp.]
MRERSESRPDYEELEENHDGRTMILLAASAAVICSLVVATGFFVFGLIFDTPTPDVVALNTTDAKLALDDQSDAAPVVTPAIATPPVLEQASSAPEPTGEERPDEDPASAIVDSEPDVTEVAAVTPEPSAAATPPTESVPIIAAPASPPTLVPGEKPEPQPPVISPERKPRPATEPMPATETAAETEPAAVTPVAAATPVSAPEEKPDAEQTVPQVKTSTRGRPLIYRWNPGEIQGYTVSMTATVNDQKQTVSGTVELTCDEQPAKSDSAASSKPKKPETGTGTGFVVSADGYLMTCAHVIQGADRIDVQLHGKTYAAEVVAVEPNDDLALLKIDADKLQSLSLADSAKVRIGEEVRAIGFPLSTVLGNGIKVTRGIVAGVVERAEGKRFQIDAAVNPGNSGGPVFNGRGHVLGVASSKLVGLELTRVGFCIPAERVLALLKAKNVSPLDSIPEKELDGPSLVEAVSPAVALITVTIDPQKVSGELVNIRTSGSFQTKNETSSQQRLMFSFPNMTFNSGSLNVDLHGDVESFSAPNQLPFLAGPMSLLTIHQFDQLGRSSWTVRNSIKVTIQQNDSPFGRRRIPLPRLPRFGGRVADPFAPKTVKEFDAQEVHQYRIVSDSDDRVVLEKTFTLTTLDNDDAPYFRISGKGEVVFSRRVGLVESFEFDHHFEKNEEKETVRIPVRISVKRQESAVVAKRKRELAIAQAKVEHDNAIKAANKTEVPVGEQLDALLQKIREENVKGGYPSSQLNSLAKLVVLPERQSEVEALLVDLLDSKQYLTVRGALGALEKWGTPNCVPAVIAQLKHSMFPVVQSAIQTLGALHDEQAIGPLLDTLRSNRSAAHYVKSALGKFGKVAEEPVIALLFEKDQQQFQAACEILKEIGGEKSVEPLESIVSGKDFFRRSYATRSLDSVKARVAAEKAVATAGGNTSATDPAAVNVEAVLKAMAAAPDQSGYARTSALMKLGESSDYKRDALEDALLKTLDDPNFAVQHQGMMALQKRATERSIPRMLKLFFDPESKLQFMAAQTLQKIGVGPDGEHQLVEQLAKSDRKIQKAIIDLLTEIGSPESLAVLDQLSSVSQATTVQYGAARAAARIRLRAGLSISS